MNWRRGLLLAWALASIVWVGVVIAAYNPIQKILNPMVAYQGIVPFEEWRAKGLSDDQIAAYLSRHAVLDYGEIAVLPPAILLAAIIGVLWAVRRVMPSPS
jgi:hypothetical protein